MIVPVYFFVANVQLYATGDCRSVEHRPQWFSTSFIKCKPFGPPFPLHVCR